MNPTMFWQLIIVTMVYLVGSAAGLADSTNHYVVPAGSPVPPYTNWATAATNIQDAVNASYGSDVVWVTNGTYYLTNKISLVWPHGITVKGFTNNGVVTVDGQNNVQCFYINSASAVVDGLNIVHGKAGSGGGVILYAGTVQNCIISSNTAINSSAYGGGVYIVVAGAQLLNSLICNNCMTNVTAMGGGVYNNGLVQNCIIVSNSVPNDGYGGGIYCYDGSTSINCLVAYNMAGYGGGMAHWLSDAFFTAINCTVVSNTANNKGGGFYNDYSHGWGVLENTIIYFNKSGSGSNYYCHYNGSSGRVIFHNCCTAPAVTNNDYCTNNIVADPFFISKDAGDWRLTKGSPCINAGTNEAWMDGAVDLDRHGRLDRYSGQVDMGAYEYLSAGSMYRLGF